MRHASRCALLHVSDAAAQRSLAALALPSRAAGAFLSPLRTHVTDARAMSASTKTIRAVAFDMDGTLTLPGAIDFKRMRARMLCPPHLDVLDHVAAAPTPAAAAALAAIIVEEELAAETRLMPDVHVVGQWLRARAGVRAALLTRNNARVMQRTLDLLPGIPFAVALSREWAGPPKPDAAPLLHIARELGVRPDEMVMVGDTIDDIECGRAAGAVAILIGETDCARSIAAAHHRVKDLTALVALLDTLLGVEGAQ